MGEGRGGSRMLLWLSEARAKFLQDSSLGVEAFGS